jgi:hypothetical protein
MSRVFVIFAPEDYLHFERLTGQARSAKLLVEFDCMHVKQAWVPAWKGQCRTKVYRCDGAVVLISKHTHQGGVEWELECARAFGIPMLGIHADKPASGSVPEQLGDAEVIEWSWPDIARFIRSLTKDSSAYA